MKWNQVIKIVHTIVEWRQSSPLPLAIIRTLSISGMLKNENDDSKLSQARSVQS